MNDLASRLQARLLAERRDGFRRLSGLELAGTLPLTSAILTQILRQGIKPGTAVTDIAIALRPNNVAVAVLALEGFLMPKRAEVAIVLTGNVATAQRPKLTAQLEVSGTLGLLLPLISGMFTRPGVTFQGRAVEFDLAELLKVSGNGDLLPLLRRLELRTETGKLFLDFQLGTEPTL